MTVFVVVCVVLLGVFWLMLQWRAQQNRKLIEYSRQIAPDFQPAHGAVGALLGATHVVPMTLERRDVRLTICEDVQGLHHQLDCESLKPPKWLELILYDNGKVSLNILGAAHLLASEHLPQGHLLFPQGFDVSWRDRCLTLNQHGMSCSWLGPMDAPLARDVASAWLRHVEQWLEGLPTSALAYANALIPIAALSPKVRANILKQTNPPMSSDIIEEILHRLDVSLLWHVVLAMPDHMLPLLSTVHVERLKAMILTQDDTEHAATVIACAQKLIEQLGPQALAQVKRDAEHLLLFWLCHGFMAQGTERAADFFKDVAHTMGPQLAARFMIDVVEMYPKRLSKALFEAWLTPLVHLTPQTPEGALAWLFGIEKWSALMKSPLGQIMTLRMGAKIPLARATSYRVCSYHIDHGVFHTDLNGVGGYTLRLTVVGRGLLEDLIRAHTGQQGELTFVEVPDQGGLLTSVDAADGRLSITDKESS